MRIVTGVFLVLLGGSCGGGDETPACPPPLVGSCTNHTGFFCTEYAGTASAATDALKNSCKGDPDEPDIWSESGCSHVGTIGACRRMQSGLCVAVWLKLPAGTSGDIRSQAVSMCAAQGGTWVDP